MNILQEHINKIKSPIRIRGAAKAEQGAVGYDNPRDNIDPHVLTKVLDTKELLISGGRVTDLAIGATQNDKLATKGYVDSQILLSGGVVNHALLNNLAWNAAGHTINATLDMNNNQITECDRVTFGGGQFVGLYGNDVTIIPNALTTGYGIILDGDHVIIGDSRGPPNYSRFESDGSLNLYGTAAITGASSISGAYIYGDGSNLRNLPAGATQYWLSSAAFIQPLGANTISGANIYTGGTISGANLIISNNISGGYIYGDGSNLRNLATGGTPNMWISSASIIQIMGSQTISGANIYTGGTISSGNLVISGNMADTQNIVPAIFVGFAGFVAGQTYLYPEWYAPYSDTNAHIDASFYVARGGTFKARMIWETDTANIGKTMSGKIYVAEYVSGEVAQTYNLLNGENWDIAIPNGAQTLSVSDYGTSFVVPDNSLIYFAYFKDDNAGGAAGNVGVITMLLVRQ